MSASESIATPVRPTSPSASGSSGVVAELRREVERDREPGLPALEQVAEARVRLLGGAVARVLPDRPRAPAVHRLVRAARERVLAGELELAVGEVVRRVDGLDLDAGVGQPAVGRFARRRIAGRSVMGAHAVRRGDATDGELELAAGALDRVERDPAAGLDVLADGVLGGVEVARREALDDPAVLGDEVRVALDLPAADHLHHQVHGQLAVEAREQRVAGEVDLVLVERGVRCVPLLVRDRGVGRVEQLGEA